MSQYLVDRIHSTPNIEVVGNGEIECVQGDTEVRTVELKSVKTEERITIAASALFIFIGVQPHTKPFIDLLACDASGFILTGADIPVEHGRPRGWPLARARYMFETNVADVIAAGDIRSGANRRRSSAAAEGHRARAARVQSFGRLLQRVLCRVGLRWRQQP